MPGKAKPTWGDAAERDADVFGQVIGVQMQEPAPPPQVVPPQPAPEERRPEPPRQEQVSSEPVAPAVVATQRQVDQTQVKRGRGRPRKVTGPVAQTMQITLPNKSAEATHSLNVRLPVSTWLPFRSYMGSQIRDMTEVIAAMVAAFNANPTVWLQLIDACRDNRADLGKVLEPWVADALESLQAELDGDGG